MRRDDINQTDIWKLYQKGKNFARLLDMYEDTNKNFRFYNGDHWHGLVVSGIEKIQHNFIKPIIKYKVGTINQNLWAIKYSAENFDKPEFQKTATKVCELLSKKAAKIWELNDMDKKCRRITKVAAINDECIAFNRWDSKKKIPIVELLNKVDVYYGNENDPEIENQPYILIRQRKSVAEVQDMAVELGVENIEGIVGDKDVFESAGDASKFEVEDNVTVITKLYKRRISRNEEPTVYYSISTESVELEKDVDTGLSHYPVAHYIWEEKEGSARGEGEVRYFIPNQIEVNKTAMRRALTVKNTAFPQRIANRNKIKNIADVSKVGSTIWIDDQITDDVRKAYSITQPASMSSDAEKVMNELISLTRELAGAGEIATGQVNPESASGRAILAVQQASQMPMTEQITTFKSFLEREATIWLEHIKVYTGDELILEEEYKEGEQTLTRVVKVPELVLEHLQASVKVDITPTTPFDKMAKEMTLENLLSNKHIDFKEYVKAIPYDSIAPKLVLEEIIKEREENQMKILEIQNQAEMLKQGMGQMVNDPDLMGEYIGQPMMPPQMPQQQIQGNV